ncbi:hypothetical protein FNF31_05407 [Cafeteria roenbergensis]|uniref:Uncharacterized protein n=1 Tax=Cafeteria roenbergensis TaxID=33653 RepID=A0A5A8CZJ5_CAFRO|nr:hypothetical protein FNF31_05407 [Cafeteria roenbergensis]
MLDSIDRPRVVPAATNFFHPAHASGDTVEVSVNFPVATPSEAIGVPFDQDTVYAIYVFDSTQGSDNTADWAFGTAPAYGITGMLGTTTLGEWRVGQEGPIQCGEALYYNGSTEVSTSSSATNVSGQVLRWLWTGSCDGDGICRECDSGVDGAVATVCSNEQVCLDGTYWRGRSIDGTMRTINNDTRAGLLLAMLLIALFCLLVALVACMCKSCCSCCSGRKSTVQSKEGGKDEATSSKTAAAATPAQP